jgi:peroxiredoxin
MLIGKMIEGIVYVFKMSLAIQKCFDSLNKRRYDVFNTILGFGKKNRYQLNELNSFGATSQRKKGGRKKVFFVIFWLIILVLTGGVAYRLFVPFMQEVKRLEAEKIASKAPIAVDTREEDAYLQKIKINWFKAGIMSDATHQVFSLKKVPIQGGWFNTTPLDLQYLRSHGYVTLLYFWSSSDLTSLYLNHFMQWLWEQYQESGLVIVGVHMPQFSVEKNPAQIWRVIQAEGLTFPILLDGDLKFSNKFQVSRIPKQYLINPKGKVVSIYADLGDEDSETLKIRETLEQAGWLLNKKEKSPDFISTITNTDTITPTLYAGYHFRRRVLGNDHQGIRDKPSLFELPKTRLPDMLYLSGEWLSMPEYLESRQAGQILIHCRAKSAYIYLESMHKEPIDVAVGIDEKPLNQKIAGHQIIFKGDQSVISLEPLMGKFYEIIDKGSLSEVYSLSLSIPAGVRFYFIAFD